MKEVPPPEEQGNEQWKPLLMFTDQSASFAHGAEFGMIYAQLSTDTFKTKAVRVENQEVLKAAAAHFHYTATFIETEVEGWVFMEIKPFTLTAV